MKPSATAIAPANRFRLGDVWRDAAGHSYTVCRAPQAHTVDLRPAGLRTTITTHRAAIAGWHRISWGGEW
jgi:hypothetical protein